MRIHDGAEFGRRLQAGQQVGGGARRHRHHDDVASADLDQILAAEIQRADLAVIGREGTQFVAELNGVPALGQEFHGGLDQNVTESVARDQGAAGLPAGEQRLAHDRAGKPRRAFGRIDVERCEQQRLHQALIEHALAGNGFADQRLFRRPDQRRQLQIIGEPGVGNAATLVEHPGRQPTVAEIDLPALPGRDIDEGKLRALRSDQARLGADRSRIGARMAVARQQQMIAIVDGEIGGAVEIRTAAAAGVVRRLVHGDLEAGIGEPHGSGKAGNSGADDMSCFLHQMRA
ncbi:hypothetical protein ACVWW3_001139 [Bradyrhizobium sp. LM2.9]